MNYRNFGRTGWQVGDIGYGMWGMGAWSGSEDSESMGSLQRAIDLGCNFFDTAWVYGDGHSEKLLGRLLKTNAAKKIFVATKVPPKNMTWPAPDQSPLDENYPPEHVTEFVERSLQNLGLDTMDLIQFHTWNDAWLENPRTAEVIENLKASGKVRAVGISLNRWQPWNGVKAVRAGLVHAVQVVYNIFDQNPEDELFPACREKNVAVIARVPFDEGSLTGTLNAETKWPEGDFRNRYFGGGNLVENIGARRSTQAAAARRHDTCGTVPAIYFEQPGYCHRNSRNAQNPQCGSERRGERQRSAFRRTACGIAQASLEPQIQ